ELQDKKGTSDVGEPPGSWSQPASWGFVPRNEPAARLTIQASRLVPREHQMTTSCPTGSLSRPAGDLLSSPKHFLVPLFLNLPFPMADDQPMWGNNQAVAPTSGAAIITVDPGDNFTVKGRGTIIQIFYHGLDEATQAILDVGGIFLYKTPNKAHQLLEDRVLLKLDWSKDMKAKPIRKTVTFTESSKDSKFMENIEALTTKIDSQFKEIKGETKEMRDGCNSFGGPHPSSECDDKPMGGPKDEKANYAYGGYRGGGYRGNYYGRSSVNWQDRQSRDANRNSQPREDIPSVLPTPKTKFNEFDFEKTMREFMKIHMTWAQLEKKRGKDTTLQDFDGALDLQWVETASRFLSMLLKLEGDDIAIFFDAVTIADLKKPIEDSAS
nr:reverse transcriptase domain-containing protein [Tanacetum cinerariifolium]